jgi:hypothetical protein
MPLVGILLSYSKCALRVHANACSRISLLTRGISLRTLSGRISTLRCRFISRLTDKKLSEIKSDVWITSTFSELYVHDFPNRKMFYIERDAYFMRRTRATRNKMYIMAILLRMDQVTRIECL